MFCTECGEDLTEDAKFCPSCGIKKKPEAAVKDNKNVNESGTGEENKKHKDTKTGLIIIVLVCLASMSLVIHDVYERYFAATNNEVVFNKAEHERKIELLAKSMTFNFELASCDTDACKKEVANKWMAMTESEIKLIQLNEARNTLRTMPNSSFR